MSKKNVKYGSGSIFQRGGKIVILFKRKQFFTGLDYSPENLKAAERKLIELNFNYNSGKQENKIYSIFEAWKKFEIQHIFNKAEKTISGYKYCKQKILTENFDLTEKNIDYLILKFLHQEKQLSENTKIIVFRHFQAFLNFCNENNLLEKKIALMKRYKLKPTKKKPLTYTETELKEIFNYFNEKDLEFSLMLQFMTYSGLRIGETLKLNWNDINFQEKIIELKNKISSDPEKIPLSKKIISILDQLPKRLDNKIFRWKNSSQSILTRKFHRYFEEKNIDRKGRNFHNFRKTFRMKLFSAGVPVESAKELLRHKDIRITINNYTEMQNDILLNDLEKI